MKEAKQKVKLVTYTPNPEHVIAEAARLCYADDERASSLFLRDIDPKDDSVMLRRLIEMRHLSPLEHASWSFLITGVSRALTHQLVRHRIASYSQRSQRYVEQGEFDFVVPPTIKEAGLEAEYTEMMFQAASNYRKLKESLARKLGLQGEAVNQDARYVLPNACETKIAVTMNGRELVSVFFNERLCNRAQWEIRSMAREMHKLAYPTAPNLFSYVGPSCVIEGKCHQGKKSCGKMAEVRDYFEQFRAEPSS